MTTLLWILLGLVIAIIVAADVFVLIRVVGAWRETRRAQALCPPLGPQIALGDASAGRMHVVDRGAPSDKPTAVLIHGAGGNLRQFTTTIVDALAAERRVVAIDRPGLGYSAPPKGYTAALGEQAAFLRAGLAKLEIEKPVLVGHSFGGAVALRYALDFPDAIAGLVLIAPGAYPFTPKPPFPRETIESDIMRKAVAWLIAVPQLRAHKDALVAAVFHPDAAPGDYDAESGGALGRRPSQIVANLLDQAALQPGLAEQAPRYPELAGAQGAPIQVLFGSEDSILVPEEHGARLQTDCPQTEVTVLPGRGHMLPYVAPDETLAAIRRVT